MRHLAVAAATLGVGVAFLVGVALFDAREEAWRHAELDVAQQARVLARTLSADLGRYDRSLRGVQAHLSPRELDRLGTAHAVALAPPDGSPDWQRWMVLDRQGQPVFARAAPVRSWQGEEFFEAQRQGIEPGLFVAPSDAGDALTLSRRLATETGAFAGIVAGELPLEDLRRTLGARAGAGVTLLRNDGLALLRLPEAGPQTAQRRLQAEVQVPDMPMRLALALPEDGIMASWWRKVEVMGGLALALCAALGGLSAALYREWRRRVSAERRASDIEAQYALIAEHSSDVITLRDLDGVLLYVSPSITELLGWMPQDLVGRPAGEMLLPQDRHLAAQAVQTLADGAAERVTEVLRARRRDGPMVWIETHARLAADPRDPHSIAVVTNIRDITARKRVEEELERTAAGLAVIAATDALTGLPNRRSFDAALTKEWRRALREATLLSLLMIDADAFKSYNDRYGHQSGDAVLRDIGACIAAAIHRAGDHAARYGGEEFAVLLPGTDADGAAQLAETIRQNVAALDLRHEGNRAGRVTITIGVACLLPQRGMEASDLVAAADQALYEAKRGGRNRVEMAPPDVVVEKVEL